MAASAPAPGQEVTAAASSVNLSLPKPLAPGKGVTRDEEREVGSSSADKHAAGNIKPTNLLIDKSF